MCRFWAGTRAADAARPFPFNATLHPVPPNRAPPPALAWRAVRGGAALYFCLEWKAGAAPGGTEWPEPDEIRLAFEPLRLGPAIAFVVGGRGAGAGVGMGGAGPGMNQPQFADLTAGDDLASAAGVAGELERVADHEVQATAFGPVEPQPTAPDAPTVVSVSPGDTTVDVTWTAPANDGGSAVTGWRLYAVGTVTGEVGPITVSGGGTTSATITSLSNADTYRVSIEAVNALGPGLRSDPSDEVVPYGIPGPAQITSLSQLPSGQVRITWTAPTANGPSIPTR